ncbi:MAG: hypothetical protein KatS3mg057_0319 [Herpetosiphonaceae bacterium]|nr:MAG: hypothetical protein KatS3mg057_0319 [Herpetosiphonaceae bacterium]
MSFTTIITEGNLIPADLLERIASGEAEGQQPADFGLERSRRLTDEIAAAWSDARAHWESFQRRLRRLNSADPATSLTREHWITPLLELLGYTLTYMPGAAVVQGRTYAISHRAGRDESAPPVHIEGIRRSLDDRAPRGGPRLSPHGLVQEYLNLTEHLWGVVTNGEQLRLLRDSSRTSRPTYIEFDLRTMMEGEKFSEFALFYRLLHRTRLPQSSDDAPRSLLEHYHQQGIEAGGRVREGLRAGVEEALLALGRGLLEHPHNQELRQALASGKLNALGYYRQLLRLVYRLLFLMVAEERRLIHGTAQGLRLYQEHYSIARLRRLVEQPGAGGGRHGDLWLGLLTTFRLLRDDESATILGVTALDGDLFGEDAIPDLETTRLYNNVLVRAIRALSLYRDQQSKHLRRVNYAALDVEELGSVYESLLDLRPVVETTSAAPFRFAAGTERKTTGSYYTRPELVQELIKSALEPVLHERLRAAGPDRQAREQAILSITVCDPACGSGHFLLAAARRLGRELAKVRSGEDQPSPDQFRRAVRDVISRCIYGVDLNPLAVDLCKLALWIEGYNSGMPLSFLDAHIRRGNSLIGATRALVEQGIPDGAFKEVTGDDKAAAAAFRKRNKKEREAHRTGQQMLALDYGDSRPRDNLAQAARQLDAAPDTSVAAVRAKAARYQQLHARGTGWYDTWTLYNLWTAAFFLPLTDPNDPTIPTTQTLLNFKHSPGTTHGLTVGRVNELAVELGFFHWELEFPQVFGEDGAGGFDVVLGNPPWERIKLQEQEHWIDVPSIAQAPNKAERERLIAEWRASDDPARRARVEKFDLAKHLAEAESRFVRASGRFPLTAVGDVNTYALFAEQARTMINPLGRAGIIVPTGIATDDTCKQFFGDLNQHRQLISLYDFENREAIFPGVHRSYKFCLLTIGETREPTRFLFFATNTEQLTDRWRGFTLTSEEIALLNPNTRTCPVFRTNADAELTKTIYRRVPVLVDEQSNINPWGVSFMAMFHMANDSHLFATAPGAGLLPLYEAKLLHQFTHRWATYENGGSREFTLDELAHPFCMVTPRYWVPQAEVEARLEGRWERRWLLGFRNITNATNERTAIFSLLPHVGVGNSAPVVLLHEQHPTVLFGCLLVTLDSLVLDFVARHKLGGTNLNFFVVKQLPVLAPDAFSAEDIAFIVPRVLELVYTAWDMQPFAEDIWAEQDEAGRCEVLARNAACNRDAPPELFAPRAGFPLPPFRWNEERRAVIRAELDARIARLYGLTRDELRYILDPADVYGPDFPGETFRVLKEKEIGQYGEYRTRRLVLEAWDREEARRS